MAFSCRCTYSLFGKYEFINHSHCMIIYRQNTKRTCIDAQRHNTIRSVSPSSASNDDTINGGKLPPILSE